MRKISIQFCTYKLEFLFPFLPLINIPLYLSPSHQYSFYIFSCQLFSFYPFFLSPSQLFSFLPFFLSWIFLFHFIPLINILFSLFSPRQYSLFFLSYSLSFSTSSSFLLINIPFFLWYAFSLIFYFPFLPNPFLLMSFSFFFVRDSEIYIFKYGTNSHLQFEFTLYFPYYIQKHCNSGRRLSFSFSVFVCFVEKRVLNVYQT